MTHEEILEGLRQAFPEAIIEVPEDVKNFTIIISKEQLLEVAAHLRHKLGFDYLSCVTAVDYPEYFELVYCLGSLERGGELMVLKVRLEDKENPAISSLSSIWGGAWLQECEVYDFFGIRFTGHPDLRRIFLWEGFPGHPLRKDFQPAWAIDTAELVAVKYAE